MTNNHIVQNEIRNRDLMMRSLYCANHNSTAIHNTLLIIDHDFCLIQFNLI